MLTDEEYKKLRDANLCKINNIRRDHGLEPIADFKLTCDDCEFRFTCEFAGDPYNTDGDCLAEK